MLQSARRFFGMFLVLLLLTSVYACDGRGAGKNNVETGEVSNKVENTNADSRTFYMAFSTFPYGYSEEAVNYTYQKIGEHADAILFHFDQGIPWYEASADLPFPSYVESELESKLSASPASKTRILSVTPLNFERSGLADNWDKNPAFHPFYDKKLNDPVIVKSYIQFCKRVIDRFKPDYFNYGIEVNLLGELKPERWPEFTDLCRQVYGELKKEYPKTPVSFTIQMHEFYKHEEQDRKNMMEIMKYTDYVAVSMYPFDYSKGKGPKEEIPQDYFKKIRTLAPEKPFAVAETALLAEDLKILGTQLQGTEDFQNQYVERLLKAAQEENAQYVVWFLLRDYDEMWVVMESNGYPEIMKAWKDNGLFDGEGNPRLGLGTWESWLKKPVKDK